MDNWFFSGTTNQVENSATFTEPIGFIMSTEFNRAKKWIVNNVITTVTPAAGTFEADPSGDTTPSSTFDTPFNDPASDPDGMIKPAPGVALPDLHFAEFVHVKAKWTTTACPGKANAVIKFTYCDYYKFLEPIIDSKTFSLAVPSFKLKADLEKMKVMDCATSDVIDFGYMNDALRNVCFNRIYGVSASQT